MKHTALHVMNLKQVLATRARATFSHRINFDVVGYNIHHDMNKWCEETCEGLWRSETYHALYWQFEQERDAMLFMLRWGSAEGNRLK